MSQLLRKCPRGKVSSFPRIGLQGAGTLARILLWHLLTSSPAATATISNSPMSISLSGAHKTLWGIQGKYYSQLTGEEVILRGETHCPHPQSAAASPDLKSKGFPATCETWTVAGNASLWSDWVQALNQLFSHMVESKLPTISML